MGHTKRTKKESGARLTDERHQLSSDCHEEHRLNIEERSSKMTSSNSGKCSRGSLSSPPNKNRKNRELKKKKESATTSSSTSGDRNSTTVANTKANHTVYTTTNVERKSSSGTSSTARVAATCTQKVFTNVEKKSSSSSSSSSSSRRSSRQSSRRSSSSIKHLAADTVVQTTTVVEKEVLDVRPEQYDGSIVTKTKTEVVALETPRQDNVSECVTYEGEWVHGKVSRIVKGEPKVLKSDVRETSSRVLREYTVVEEKDVPVTVVREDIIERKVVIPDLISEEEVVQGRMRSVKVPKVKKVVKKVEVPEEHVIYTDIEVPTPSGNVVREPVYVPKKVVKPRVCRIVEERLVEQVVEEDVITYVDKEEVTEVEVPQVVQVTKYNDIPVPTYVDKHVEVVEDVTRDRKVAINIPLGVEAITRVKYSVPRIKEVVTPSPYKIYVPRFIEEPVNSVQLTTEQLKASRDIKGRIEDLGASICAVEQVALEANENHSVIQTYLDQNDLKSALIKNFAH